MSTPQHVFAEIACRFGVNPLDPLAIDAFFKNISTLPTETRQAIIMELTERENELPNEIDDLLLEARLALPVPIPEPSPSEVCGVESLDPLPPNPPRRPNC